MIKLIATDLDGTLLNNKRENSCELSFILKKLKEKGIFFVAASGRSKYSIIKNFENSDDEIFYISDNGAFVSDKNNEYFVNEIKYEYIENVVNILKDKKEIQIILCGKKCSYLLKTKDEFFEDVTFFYNKYKKIENLEEIKGEKILKIAIFDSIGSSKNSYLELKDNIPNEIIAVVSSSEWMDIMNKGITKGSALNILQEKLGIKKEETMAFGDCYNDIEMLKSAEYSFAMENSNSDIKKVCKYIAPSNEDFGVIKIIKKYVL